MRNTVFISMVLAAGLLAGCGSSAEVSAPGTFVVLDDDYGDYDQRITNAHGVVVGVRDLDNEVEGGLEFWVDAIKNRLRTRGGYALLDEGEVRAGSGHTGHQMRYGRDEGGTSYHYWVSVFVTTDRIVVVEAGGRREIFEEAEAEVEQAVASLQLD